MADFLINSLRGGLNEDAPISIGDDQCTVANNVEFHLSRLGERRLGSDGIDLTGSGVEDYDRVTWVYRHLPSTDIGEAQLWLLAVKDSPATATFVYKDSAGWHTVSPVDAINQSFVYEVSAQTLHGKLFIAYKSAVNRLHVWDGTSLRRTGLAEPAAPTGANQGVGTLPTTTRYYRVRYVVMSGSTVLRRSEHSDALTFTPSGTGLSVRITKPASISESETHWELELSADNSNFYRIARTAVGTTTFDDTQSLTTLAQVGTLSATSGDYEVIPSVRYLTADQDRLIGGGGFEGSDLASRVMWTPVLNDPGDGNDERIPVETVNFLNLDGYEGGTLTGLSGTVNGYVYAFKVSHVYQLGRSGVRTRAYEAVPLTKKRGAIPGSLVEAFDSEGNPTLFFADQDIGPCRYGPRGVEPCGADLIRTWATVNLDATVVARGVYFPEKQQVHWWVATGASSFPDTRLVLHTRELRGTPDGMRRGWAKWSGVSAAALTACVFSDNIDSMGSGASNVLVPFIGRAGSGLVLRTDTGNDDNGTAYAARIVSKPYVHGNLLHQFASMAGALMAKAASGVTIDVTVMADFGKVEKEVSDVSLAPAGAEERVIKMLDSLSLAEIRTLQVEFEDSSVIGGQWQLEQFGLKESPGQRS